jgi:hypothetical protein
VDHPGWKQIFQTKESKLLHDFRYRFPDMGISGLSIVLCKQGAESREQRKEIGEKTLAERAKASVVQEPVGSAAETRDTRYGAIKDEALRSLLERLEKRIAEKEGYSSS